MRNRKALVLAAFIITWSFVTYYFILRSASSNTSSNYTLMKKHIPQMKQNLQEQFEELNSSILKEHEKSKSLTNDLIRYLKAKYRGGSKEPSEQFPQNEAPPEKPDGLAEPPPDQGQNPLMSPLEEAQLENAMTTIKSINLPAQTHLANGEPVIPILIFACNRVTIKKCLDNLLMYRKSQEQFPIIVSQDCGDEATKNVILSYKDQLHLIEQPDQSDIFVPPKEKKFKGYYKIARHYGWALNTTFHNGYDFVVIVEDDLNVAPDFFEYFLGTYKLLKQDPSLWCISAWNDNGKENFVDPSQPELLYRTDFFPGLGWMLTRELWQELSVKWPKSFWDDWIRHPAQRKDRVCIRPELSRTKTFGKIGVSNGLFFDKYLKYIKLSTDFVPFTKMNLTYLLKENYDKTFLKKIYTYPVVTYDELRRNLITVEGPVRITYSTREQYKRITKMLGLMDDLKSGVPRTAYHGIVSFFYSKRRVHLAPNANWKGYDLTWS